MNIISGIGESGFLAHSAFSAGIATKDSNGNDITATYLTGVDLTPYQTIEGMTAYQEAGDYLTTADSGSFLTAVPDTYLQNTDLEISDNKITGISGIPLAAGGGVTGDYELSAGSGISIEDYPLEQKTVISVTAQGGNPEVEQAVIDNSATWDSVTSKADATAIPSTAGLATESFVTSQGYITNDAITGKQDITGMTAYATVESLTAKQDAGDYLSASDSANFLLTSDSGNFYPMNENPAGYLTEHQSLADYQTTAGMTAYLTTGDSAEFMTTAERSDYIPTGVSSEFYTTANTAGYISTVPDTYLQNTDLSTADGKVTAISGIPLSAGGDVPEGVMVESGLEYDNTEISGYSGSAFKDVALTDVVTANSGVWGGSALPVSAGKGVKISLQDDTLVFEADETVLASGIANDATAFTLSEEAGNFERLRLYDTYGNIVEVAGDNSRLTWVFDRTNSNGTRMNRCYTITSTDGINWNELNVYGWNQTAYTGELSLNGGTDWYLETHKIVGINRIAGE